MFKLLKKEVSLSMHPTVPIMMCLVFMVLIPNYPYLLICFYTILATFFTCLVGRENNDIIYTMMLPIAKADVVKGRIIFTVCQQVLQMILLVPFIFLSAYLNPIGNQVGTDANIALIGIAFLTYGISNLVFYTVYYKNVSKVGFAFLCTSIVVTIIIIVDIIMSHAWPLYRDVIDCPGTQNITYQLIVLVIGVIGYITLTVMTYKRSVRLFIKQDL